MVKVHAIWRKCPTAILAWSLLELVQVGPVLVYTLTHEDSFFLFISVIPPRLMFPI